MVCLFRNNSFKTVKGSTISSLIVCLIPLLIHVTSLVYIIKSLNALKAASVSKENQKLLASSEVFHSFLLITIPLRKIILEHFYQVDLFP